MSLKRRPAGGRYTALHLLVLGVLLLLAAPASMAQSEAEQPEAKFSKAGADGCLRCHKEEAMQHIFRTPHGQGADPDAPFASLQCESCHGPRGRHPRKDDEGGRNIIGFGSAAVTPVAEQNAMCMSCHTTHLGYGWEGSAHARNDIACADCHNVHEPVDKVSLRQAQPEVCYSCHQEVRAQLFKPYAHPVRQGLMTCTDCHSPHSSAGDSLLARNNTNELCYSCHAEYRGPVLWEHAPVSEDCGTCHDPHGSIHPAMLEQRAPLLCQSCHSQQGHPSVAWGPGGLANGSPSPFVLNGACLNCHSQVHGSNHPSGADLMR